MQLIFKNLKFKSYRGMMLLAADFTIAYTPFNSLIKVLKAVRLSFVLILRGRLSQILGPEDLSLLVPNVG